VVFSFLWKSHAGLRFILSGTYSLICFRAHFVLQNVMEAGSNPPGQEIPGLLWKLKIPYCVHNL
jgi:hypothetical protein